LGLTGEMDVRAQLAVIGAARGQTREQAPATQVLLGEVGMEQDDRILGGLAGEAYVQAQHEAGVMKKRVIPPPGIDPVFVPLACEVPRPFSSSLVQRVQGFFCTKRAPVWWKRLPELFVSPLLWWWRPSQQHSRSGQSIHSLPGPVPSV